MNEGAPINFSSFGSAPGSGATSIDTYAWNFGDGQGTSNLANPTYTYPDDSGTGTRTVTLNVTDDNGGKGSASATIKVNNVAPTIPPGGVTADPNPVGEGTPTTVTVSATDPAGTNDPLQFSFDCDGLAGTGSGGFEIGPQPGNTTTCSYPDNTAQPVQVNVRVDDGDGGVTTGSVNITVNNLPPTGTISASPATINEGGTASIIANFTDPAGTLDPLKYSFDCDGNGLFTDAGDVADKTTNSHPCTFLDDSDHIVNVRVDDGDGGIANANTKVTVNNVAPVVTVTADPSILPKSGDSTITATATDVAADEAAGFTYSFDCNGNGVFTDPGDKGPQSTNSATCFFRVPEDQGTKTVNVRVVDKDAGAGNGSVIVNVGSPDAPTLIFPIKDTPVLLRPVFQWKGDDLSSFYDIEVAKGGFPTATPRTISDIPHSGAADDLQSKQIPTPALDAGSLYEWRVRAKTTTGADPLAGEYSTASFITVGAQMTLVLQVTLQGTGTPAVTPKFDAFRDPSEPRWAIFGRTPISVFSGLTGSASGRTYTISIPNVTTGFYDITIESDRTLVNLKDDARVHLAAGTIDMGTLKEGNAVNGPREGSSIINALDASALATELQISKVTDRNPIVDFNRDGTVDAGDLTLLQGNYLEFSPVLVSINP